MKTAEREFPVCVVQTLYKDSSINTSDYVVLSTSKDEDGYLDEDVSLENVNLLSDYNKDHYTALELINQLKKLTDLLLSKQEKVFRLTKSEIQHIRFLNKESQNWQEEETDVAFD